MINLQDIKRRKRKRGLIIVTSISAVLITSLVIVAFLSSYVGNFTISIGGSLSKLAFSTNADMANSTTYMRTDGFTDASPISLNELKSDDSMDSNSGGSKNIYSAKTDGMEIFVYTFFVSNVGTDPIFYYYGIDMSEPDSTSDAYLISDILRIRVYQNILNKYGDQTHSYIDYTKKNVAYDTAGIGTDARNYLIECDKQATAGTLQYFNSGDNIIYSGYSSTRLYSKEVIRYTIAMWLEGDDPDCTGDYPTAKSAIRLSAFVGSKSADQETSGS